MKYIKIIGRKNFFYIILILVFYLTNFVICNSPIEASQIEEFVTEFVQRDEARSSEEIKKDISVIGVPSIEWERIYAKESERILKKACEISKKEREFDIINYKEFTYFSSNEKQDMLIHSNQYLGGGNSFGWVVLEQLDDNANNKIVFEKYSAYTDGRFINIKGKVLLEVIDEGASPNKIDTILYEWRVDSVEEILRYHSTNYSYQSPFIYKTYRIVNNETKQIYIVKYLCNQQTNVAKYSVDLYDWSVDKWRLKKKDLKFVNSLKTKLIKLDSLFPNWLKDLRR